MGETVRIASRLYRGRTVSGLPVLSSGRRLCSMLSPLLRSTGRPRRSILNRSLAFNWSPLPQHIKPFSRAQLAAPAAAYHLFAIFRRNRFDRVSLTPDGRGQYWRTHWPAIQFGCSQLWCTNRLTCVSSRRMFVRRHSASSTARTVRAPRHIQGAHRSVLTFPTPDPDIADPDQ